MCDSSYAVYPAPNRQLPPSWIATALTTEVGDSNPEKQLLAKSLAVDMEAEMNSRFERACSLKQMPVFKRTEPVFGDSNTVDRISEIFSQANKENFFKMTLEIKKITNEHDDDFLRWLAYYIVTKRVCVEDSKMVIFEGMLEGMRNSKLYGYVKQETTKGIKIILQSIKGPKMESVRELLVKLGRWLGLITIGRDRPITMNDIDLKEVVRSSYRKGGEEPFYVVPFIAKVLAPVAKSQVYGPRCAWIQGILRELVWMQDQPDFNIRLRFDIHVLFKKLAVPVSDMRHRPAPTSYDWRDWDGKDHWPPWHAQPFVFDWPSVFDAPKYLPPEDFTSSMIMWAEQQQAEAEQAEQLLYGDAPAPFFQPQFTDDFNQFGSAVPLAALAPMIEPYGQMYGPCGQMYAPYEQMYGPCGQMYAPPGSFPASPMIGPGDQLYGFPAPLPFTPMITPNGPPCGPPPGLFPPMPPIRPMSTQNVKRNVPRRAVNRPARGAKERQPRPARGFGQRGKMANGRPRGPGGRYPNGV